MKGDERVDLVIGPASRLFHDLEVTAPKVDDNAGVALLKATGLAASVGLCVVDSVLDIVKVGAIGTVALPHLAITVPLLGDPTALKRGDDIADRLDPNRGVEVEVLNVATTDFDTVGRGIVDFGPRSDDLEPASNATGLLGLVVASYWCRRLVGARAGGTWALLGIGCRFRSRARSELRKYLGLVVRIAALHGAKLVTEHLAVRLARTDHRSGDRISTKVGHVAELVLDHGGQVILGRGTIHVLQDFLSLVAWRCAAIESASAVCAESADAQKDNDGTYDPTNNLPHGGVPP